jgi:DtxR family transcriptional regulator, Mn-dependent transcriptional regulator
MLVTKAEENYLKAIYKIAEKDNKSAGTNRLAETLNTSPASITDMIKKMAEKGLVNYQKYQGVSLTSTGNKIATNLIRKHRLWELFLVDKLRFAWHQVHEIAEDLEHIHSEELVARLDAYLNFPRFDPHGDPIPNADGKFTLRSQTPLSDLVKGQKAVLVGLKDNNDDFLKYLHSLGVKIGTKFTVLEKVDYDKSLQVSIDERKNTFLSGEVTQQLIVKYE